MNVLTSNCLKDILDVRGRHNFVIRPTCFKLKVPIPIDVVITNVSKSVQQITGIACDLSDFRRIVMFRHQIARTYY